MQRILIKSPIGDLFVALPQTLPEVERAIVETVGADWAKYEYRPENCADTLVGIGAILARGLVLLVRQRCGGVKSRVATLLQQRKIPIDSPEVQAYLQRPTARAAESILAKFDREWKALQAEAADAAEKASQ